MILPSFYPPPPTPSSQLALTVGNIRKVMIALMGVNNNRVEVARLASERVVLVMGLGGTSNHLADFFSLRV